MASAIEEIVGRISAGMARANRYKVFMPNGDGDTLNILCDAVTIPGRQILTEDYYTNMRANTIAYAFGNADIDISWYVTNNWEAWDYINDWHEKIIESPGGLPPYQLLFKNDYQEDIEIHHLDTENNPRKRIRVFNAFPKTLNSIDLSNGNSDLLRVTATFAYDNWIEI